jgi:hypothetical protein
MSTKRKLLLPAAPAFVASAAIGTVVTLDLPLGYRYHEISIGYVDGGSSPNDITALFGDIIVYRNGTPERTHTSLELDHLNGLNGSQYQRQQLGTGANMRQVQTIFFAEPWRKDKVDTDRMAWSVDAANGFRTFQIKLTTLVQIPSTASFFAWARVDDALKPPQNGQQSVKKVYRAQIPASGSSNDVTTLDARDAYQVISLKHPTGAYIQYATLKNNGVIMFERVRQEDNAGDLTNLGLNPATSQTAGAFGYDIVLDADDPLYSAMPATAPWLKLEYSATASGNVVALIERLGPLD